MLTKFKKAYNKLVSRHIHSENDELFKKFHSLKECIILGSAPSINKYDLSKLNDKLLIISLGNFHEHEEIELINPRIHFFAKAHFPITQTVLENWWKRAHIKLPKSTIVIVEKDNFNLAKAIFIGRHIYTYSYGGTFPVNFENRIVTPWSVTQIAIQLTIFLKITNIYLLGINHDWQSCKPYNHFYSHAKPSLEFYLHQEGILTRNEQLKQPMPKEKMYRSYELYQLYEKLKIEAELNDLNIYNIDKYSHFDVFDFKSIIMNKYDKS